MTGQVFTATPPHRVSVAYSIDSFSEYSTTAVSRTPTRAIIPPTSSASFSTCMDEELFRDLFADADADAEQRDVVFGAGHVPPLKKSKANVAPSKAMVWQTGATLTKPFASPVPPHQIRNQASPAAPPSVSVAPSLNVPLPRQNAVDLITARPRGAPSDDEQASTLLGLSRVPEVNEDEEEEELSIKSKSARRLVNPVGPVFSSKKSRSTSIQDETLQFLEKLDLKSLLAQPRPDVTSFLPPSNQTHHVLHDPRTEDVDQSACPSAPLVSGVPSRKPLSSRKEPLHPLPEGATRLTHMAQTYGTTTSGPRKARKETIDRLSNPILGHTSTLQALSPESRKKREAELGMWPPPEEPTTPVKTLTSRKTKALIERLAEAQSTTFASSVRGGVKKLIKGKKPTKLTIRPLTNNNQDDAERAARSTGAKPRQVTIDERKAVLKQKLATRTSTQPKPATESLTSSTFLTQHEDTEAKLSKSSNTLHRGNRKLVPQRPNDSKPTHGRLHLPQRPVVPPLVRTRVSTSTTAQTPSKPSNSTVRTARGGAVSATKEARSAKSPQRHYNREREPSRPERKRVSKTKNEGLGAESSRKSASSALLGTSSRPSKQTPASAEKSLSRSSMAKPKPPSEQTRESLPLIRRAAPPAPERPAAPAARRSHRIRATE